jgi:hypothetical protein
MTAKKKSTSPAARLRERALSFPGAWEDSPWGDSVIVAPKKLIKEMSS